MENCIYRNRLYFKSILQRLHAFENDLLNNVITPTYLEQVGSQNCQMVPYFNVKFLLIILYLFF